ncbi:MAG: TraB/GumN family protein [Nanoarchaeota archaeon]|nr:TraB/GumN family protein [Nanoarchaeota archaeon]
MLSFRNLSIIGTSHIARESVEEIKRFVNEQKPGIIAVELDQRRLYALLHNIKSKVRLRDIRTVGLKGFLFAVFGSWAQKKLGNIVKIEPGAEMKTASKLALQQGVQLALIDRDITVTLKEFSRRLTWKERFRFIGDIFRFMFFRKREMKRLGIEKLDLTKVPEEALISKLMHELKTRYPNVYKVLVADRNRIMAHNLFIIMTHNPTVKILAVVGAGHQEELLEMVVAKCGPQAKKEAISI